VVTPITVAEVAERVGVSPATRGQLDALGLRIGSAALRAFHDPASLKLKYGTGTSGPDEQARIGDAGIATTASGRVGNGGTNWGLRKLPWKIHSR